MQSHNASGPMTLHTVRLPPTTTALPLRQSQTLAGSAEPYPVHPTIPSGCRMSSSSSRLRYHHLPMSVRFVADRPEPLRATQRPRGLDGAPFLPAAPVTGLGSRTTGCSRAAEPCPRENGGPPPPKADAQRPIVWGSRSIRRRRCRQALSQQQDGVPPLPLPGCGSQNHPPATDSHTLFQSRYLTSFHPP